MKIEAFNYAVLRKIVTFDVYVTNQIEFIDFNSGLTRSYHRNQPKNIFKKAETLQYCSKKLQKEKNPTYISEGIETSFLYKISGICIIIVVEKIRIIFEFIAILQTNQNKKKNRMSLLVILSII